MAQIQPRTPGRKAARYGIPAAVAALAAATVGLVPALASSGDPDLPKISAQELVEKMAASDTQHMSGTVKITTDFGLPELPGMSGGSGKQGGGLFGGGAHGEGGERGGDGKKPSAAPQDKLMELAQGEHTLRVAADGPDKQRVSIVEDTEEYSFIHNGDEVWAYDSGSNSAFHAKDSGAAGGGHRGGHGKKFDKGLGSVTPQEAAKQALKAAEKSTSVTVDGTAAVAGRDAYQLLIKPKDATHSTVDSVRIAVDEENGTPLKFTLNPKGGGKPVVEVAYTRVDFGKPAADTFRFKPPKGTDVIEEKAHGKKFREHGSEHGRKSGKFEKFHKGEKGGNGGKFGKGERPGMTGMTGMNTLGEGWGAVAVIKGPKSADPPKGEKSKESGEARDMLGTFTDEVKGDFGTGHVFSTRLVNALMTDDGTVYVGAVTKEGLIKAADAATD
jgi:outer membrane lipoprotein-sorting protein